MGLIGRTGPAEYSPDWFKLRVRDENLRAQLKTLAITDGLQLFGCWLAGPETLREFSRNAEINTDDRPVVMFEAPRFYYLGRTTSYGRLMTLLELRKPDSDGWMQGTDSESAGDFRDRLRRFISARDVYLRGLVMEAEGNMNSALDAYIESARWSPDFSTGHARCLTIAAQQASFAPQQARLILERLIKARPENPVAMELLERLNRR
jgi:spermidine synthase